MNPQRRPEEESTDIRSDISFADYFSESAEGYARYRPGYPPPLFEWLASLCARRELAWDCATGNGQAAIGLTAHFARVVATDASAQQIDRATPHERVTYRVAPRESSGLEGGSVDLVTVAQALHWLDLDHFYAEVRRVGAPGAVLAAWCYNLFSIDARLDPVVNRFAFEAVGPYWPAERALVAGEYRTLPFPFLEMDVPRFAMEERWDLDRVIGYLGTWSAVRRYREATGADPIETLRPELERAWGDPSAAKTVRWPLGIRVGRI